MAQLSCNVSGLTSEEREACLRVIILNLKKGTPLKLRMWDGEEIEARFQRFIYKGMVLKNRAKYYRIKCLDVEVLTKLDKL